MVRKVFRTGNSLVVSLPRETIELIGIHEGSEVTIDVNQEERLIVLAPVEPAVTGVDPAFARQLEEFIAQYRPALLALAKR